MLPIPPLCSLVVFESMLTMDCLPAMTMATFIRSFYRSTQMSGLPGLPRPPCPSCPLRLGPTFSQPLYSLDCPPSFLSSLFGCLGDFPLHSLRELLCYSLRLLLNLTRRCTCFGCSFGDSCNLLGSLLGSLLHLAWESFYSLPGSLHYFFLCLFLCFSLCFLCCAFCYTFRRCGTWCLAALRDAARIGCYLLRDFLRGFLHLLLDLLGLFLQLF